MSRISCSTHLLYTPTFKKNKIKKYVQIKDLKKKDKIFRKANLAISSLESMDLMELSWIQCLL